MSEENKNVLAYIGFYQENYLPGVEYSIGGSFSRKGKPLPKVGPNTAYKHPLCIFDENPIGPAKFLEVVLSGDVREGENEAELYANSLIVRAELELPQLVDAAIKHTCDSSECLPENSIDMDREAVNTKIDQNVVTANGKGSIASASGSKSAALVASYNSVSCVTGDWGAAVASGEWGVALATGDWSVASATGGYGIAATTGTHSAAHVSHIDCAAVATGDLSAACTTGVASAALATGIQSAATATCYNSVAMATGPRGRAMGVLGCALFLVEHDANHIMIATWTGIVGKEGIKENTFYVLENGTPREV